MSGVDGRRTRVRRGGFASLAHAERARLNFLALPDIATAGRDWTMQRRLEYWLSSMQEQIRASTMRSSREHVRRYLIPYLGRLRLASLRTAQLQAAFRIIISRRIPSGRLLASTRRLATLIAEAGLPPVRLHDLRHGGASLALAAGVDLKAVQEMLGHASIVTTADIYTNVLSEAAHAAAQASAAFVLDAARTRLTLGGASQA